MKKIMFNDKYGLTSDVLAGRKTMTRRIATELNHSLIEHISEWGQDEKCRAMLSVRYETGLYNDVYPHYQPGEIVAVAQSYSNLREVLAKRDFNRTDALYDKFYRALQMGEAHDGMNGWNNKMFVRADLMPHRIKITGIKFEKLRDISSEDCLREGIEARVTGCHTFYYIHGEERPYNFPKQAFAALIDKVSGRGTWERNPWVFVYEFKLIK